MSRLARLSDMNDTLKENIQAMWVFLMVMDLSLCYIPINSSVSPEK